MKKEMKIGKEGYEVPSLTFSYNCPFGGYKRHYGQSYRYGKARRRCFHQPSERRGNFK